MISHIKAVILGAQCSGKTKLFDGIVYKESNDAKPTENAYFGRTLFKQREDLLLHLWDTVALGSNVSFDTRLRNASLLLCVFSDRQDCEEQMAFLTQAIALHQKNCDVKQVIYYVYHFDIKNEKASKTRFSDVRALAKANAAHGVFAYSADTPFATNITFTETVLADSKAILATQFAIDANEAERNRVVKLALIERIYRAIVTTKAPLFKSDELAPLKTSNSLEFLAAINHYAHKNPGSDLAKAYEIADAHLKFDSNDVILLRTMHQHCRNTFFAQTSVTSAVFESMDSIAAYVMKYPKSRLATLVKAFGMELTKGGSGSSLPNGMMDVKVGGKTASLTKAFDQGYKKGGSGSPPRAHTELISVAPKHS